MVPRAGRCEAGRAQLDDERIIVTRSAARNLAAALIAAVAATSAAVALAASAHSATAKQVMTLQEPRPRVAEDDLPPRSSSKLSLGDRLAIGGSLQDARHRHLGSFGGTCTVVGTGRSFETTPLACQAIYQLAGGQIVAIGMMTLSKTSLVIVGGSGAYAKVHGLVSPGRPAKGFSDADKLTIDR